MKRKTTAALVLGLSFLLTACSPGGAAPSAENGTAAQKKPIPTETVYDDSLIGESIREDGSITDEFDQKIEYSYHVPQLLAKTDAAREINADITADAGAAAEEALKELKTEQFSPNLSISWKSHWNDSLLCLVIRKDRIYHDTEFTVYSYDFKTEKRLERKDLLERAGVSEAELESALRRAAAKEFDTANRDAGSMYGEGSFSALAELRAQTLSSRNLTPELAPVFLAEDHQLMAAVHMATMAGGGVYSTILELELPEPAGIEKSAECGWVTAKLKNNQVTLTFAQTQDSHWYLPEKGVEYGKSYPVEGLYGTYTDLALFPMGQDFYPYLFLTDERGQITFCDVINCALSGGRFFAAGPLQGIQNTAGYEAASDEGGHGVNALDGDGRATGLDLPVMEAQTTLQVSLPESTWSTTDGTHVLSISGDAPRFSWSGGGGLLGEASLFYGGTTGEGLIYPFLMWTEEGERIGGILTIPVDTSYVSPDGIENMTMTVLTGASLSGASGETPVKLVRSWG